MRVAVGGSTGVIGSALVARLQQDGHEVVRLVRPQTRTARTGGSGSDPGTVRWNPRDGTVGAAALAGVDAVVNLAGVGIGQRPWTARVRREITDSRVRSTRLLAQTLAGLAGGGGPRVLVVASAVGYYGDRGDEQLTEGSLPGKGFLAGVCRAWEAAADPARAAGVRVVHVRTGLVQARGGMLARELPLFRLGLGGRLGSGRQWWSWVALDDVVGVYRHAITTEELRGPVNATAPNPVTNAEHAATLARVLGRPAVLAVPRFAPRLVLGDMAEELLFYSARVAPAAALATGYGFRFPSLEPALRHVLRRPPGP
jgi:uncharacterized protein (TIGR01777 family)